MPYLLIKVFVLLGGLLLFVLYVNFVTDKHVSISCGKRSHDQGCHAAHSRQPNIPTRIPQGLSETDTRHSLYFEQCYYTCPNPGGAQQWTAGCSIASARRKWLIHYWHSWHVTSTPLQAPHSSIYMLTGTGKAHLFTKIHDALVFKHGYCAAMAVTASTGMATAGIHNKCMCGICCSALSPCQGKPYTHGLGSTTCSSLLIEWWREPWGIQLPTIDGLRWLSS